jgi:hypothetical protein
MSQASDLRPRAVPVGVVVSVEGDGDVNEAVGE